MELRMKAESSKMKVNNSNKFSAFSSSKSLRGDALMILAAKMTEELQNSKDRQHDGG